MTTTAAAHSRELRGSQKLLEGIAKNGETPTLEEIRHALSLPTTVQLHVPNWLTRGTPQAYLELDATLQVPIAHLNEVVDRFVKLNDSSINMNILINGIPIPEIAQIRVRNTPGPV